jgi:hypothetical protein
LLSVPQKDLEFPWLSHMVPVKMFVHLGVAEILRVIVKVVGVGLSGFFSVNGPRHHPERSGSAAEASSAPAAGTSAIVA